MAVSAAAQETQWLRMIMTELGYESSSPTVIFEDNQSCIELTHNSSNHPRTKHMAIRHHFIRELVKSRQLKLQWIKSEDNLADILTKPLSTIAHQRLYRQLMNTN
jgi:hypothetical protein